MAAASLLALAAVSSAWIVSGTACGGQANDLFRPTKRAAIGPPRGREKRKAGWSPPCDYDALSQSLTSVAWQKEEWKSRQYTSSVPSSIPHTVPFCPASIPSILRNISTMSPTSIPIYASFFLWFDRFKPASDFTKHHSKNGSIFSLIVCNVAACCRSGVRCAGDFGKPSGGGCRGTLKRRRKGLKTAAELCYTDFSNSGARYWFCWSYDTLGQSGEMADAADLKSATGLNPCEGSSPSSGTILKTCLLLRTGLFLSHVYHLTTRLTAWFRWVYVISDARCITPFNLRRCNKHCRSHWPCCVEHRN